MNKIFEARKKRKSVWRRKALIKYKEKEKPKEKHEEENNFEERISERKRKLNNEILTTHLKNKS